MKKAVSIHIDIAELVFVVSKISQDKKAEWLDSFVETLVLNNESNSFATKLLKDVKEFQAVKAEKARQSANARWHKQDNANKCERMQPHSTGCETMRNDANYAKEQNREEQIRKDNKEKDTIVSKKKEVAPPDGVDEQVWNDWMKIRKAKRVPITETALQKFSALAKDYGLTTNQLIEICIERGWASATDNYLSNAGYTKADATYEEYWNEDMGRREMRRKA